MALTKKGLVYLIIAYAFIGLALFFREPALTAFVIPNALLLLFSTRSSSTSQRIVRQARPLRSFGGESISVSVEFTNTSDAAIDEVKLEDSVPEPLVLEAGTRILTMYMRPHERVEFGYRISAPKRGRYVLGPLLLQTTDVMGFHESKKWIASRTELSIMPQIEKLGVIALRARRVGQWPGLVPSRRIGSGTEFFELRPYEPGDELRRINWKASAKAGSLITNEPEGERVTDVLVVVDVSEGTLSKLFDFDVPEFELSLAASLCSQLISQGNRVGLSVYSAARTWVDPGFGKRHLLRLLNNLTIAKPGRASIPMQYAVESVIISLVPSRSVLVFISPLVGEEILKLIVSLADRGYAMMCFTPATGTNVEVTRSRILAKRILTIERRVKMVRVSGMARLVEFSPNLDLKHELRRWTPRKQV